MRGLTVLSTPHPRALTRSLVRSDQALRSLYVGFFQLPGLPEAALARSMPSLLERSGLPPEDAARYAERMREPGALRAALNWYRALPLARRGVGPVHVPTTYVWGSRDAALGRCAAEDTEAHVLAPYRFVELDAGHWLPETVPDVVADAVTGPPGDQRTTDAGSGT
ncbi:hypothetical protein [Cellulosimicrobium sp. Marseille-Q8652]